jgi:hypothetical protein
VADVELRWIGGKRMNPASAWKLRRADLMYTTPGVVPEVIVALAAIGSKERT